MRGRIRWTWPSQVHVTPRVHALTRDMLAHVPLDFCVCRACCFSTFALVCLPMTCWKRVSACDRESYKAVKPHMRKTRADMLFNRSMGPTNVQRSKGSNAEFSGEQAMADDPGHITCHRGLVHKIRVPGSNYSRPSLPTEIISC
jgi:hypothetical protein